jgi:hypothetical protein
MSWLIDKDSWTTLLLVNILLSLLKTKKTYYLKYFVLRTNVEKLLLKENSD